MTRMVLVAQSLSYGPLGCKARIVPAASLQQQLSTILLVVRGNSCLLAKGLWFAIICVLTLGGRHDTKALSVLVQWGD